MSKKKYLFIIGILLCVFFALTVVSLFLGDKGQNNKSLDTTNEAWSPDNLREGLETVIEYDKQYSAYVESKEVAAGKIRQYGEIQRDQYDNPEVEAIELQMEEDYGILAVNLGEIDVETAGDIEKAFAYMYETYPVLQGTLTNLTIGNFQDEKVSFVAETHYREFIINGDYAVRPTVVKHEIVLSAAKFRNREKLLKTCETSIEEGHWMQGTDITALVVHELGHHLQNVIAMKSIGFEDIYYITEDNESEFSIYMTDGLSYNQTIAKEIDAKAYELWQEEFGQEGTLEEFRASISGYARGMQGDGGISYGETFAEAIADVYLHGDEATAASKALVTVAEERLVR